MDLSEANSTDSAGFEFFKLNFYPFYYSVMQCAPWKIIIFFCSLWKCWSIYIGVLQQKLQYSKMSAIPNEQKLLISFRFNIKKNRLENLNLRRAMTVWLFYILATLFTNIYSFLSLSLWLNFFVRHCMYDWVVRLFIHVSFSSRLYQQFEILKYNLTSLILDTTAR